MNWFIPPSGITFNTLLSALARTKDGLSCLRVLHAASALSAHLFASYKDQERKRSEAETEGTALEAEQGKAAAISGGVVGELEGGELDSFPTVVTMNTVMSGLANAGLWRLALGLLDVIDPSPNGTRLGAVRA